MVRIGRVFAWLCLRLYGRALKAGLFGVPSFILQGKVKPEMFFGVDHMDFLARACHKS